MSFTSSQSESQHHHDHATRIFSDCGDYLVLGQAFTCAAQNFAQGHITTTPIVFQRPVATIQTCIDLRVDVTIVGK